jgi:transcriptional regulator with XRE-family HTH domain
METRDKGAKLGEAVRQAREAKGLSTRGLAEAIGTTHSYIHKLEAGWFGSISPENIQALARALDIDAQDLFALAGYKVPDGLPTLVPYMRTKYGEDLPEAGIAELQSYFGYLRTKYGTSGASRPLGDEDEDDDVEDVRASHGGQR